MVFHLLHEKLYDRSIDSGMENPARKMPFM